ncbi:MAG: D-alanyl-D-alanine carboxypeptidase/D-alanyl-D-alanine-endopeptidase [Bacteroidota bacterium]|nr:D-alanyl-D-alanine carboxypeptidase/D-alanyl-D-alanine-endopeptidase [Bacteroidota bacterium]
MKTRSISFDFYRDARLYVSIITFVILFTCLRVSGNSQVNNYIRDFVNDTSFRHAGISICFRDAESGNIIADYHKDMALGSASVMKLVTTAVTLETLGPDFRFATRVGYTGNYNEPDSILNGYIVLKGGADPTILSEYFPEHNKAIIDEWADALYKSGIRKVTGSVVADAMIFDYHPAPGGWNWSDLGNYYGAGAHGICIFDNMYRIHFRTGYEGSIPEIRDIVPEIPGLIIENNLISYGNRDNGYVYLEPYGNHAVIRGEIPTGKDDFVLKASIPDPPLLTAILLQEALEKRGISFDEHPTSLRLSPVIAREFSSSPKSIITTTLSPTLSDIIKVTNIESLNMFAEQLLKYLGLLYTKSEFASFESGLDAVKESLDFSLDDTGGLYMTDGSGLSRSNAISSSFLTSLLYYMNSKSMHAKHFYNSLPEAGKTGTLEHYFKDPVFYNNLRAKSGTSTRIRNYAGYFKTSKGQDIAFAVLVNNFDCNSSEVTGRVESLLKKVIDDF